jgi:glycosyltransferase involved in cell wall biosynthesis
MIKVGLTTSVIQKGKTGIAQWLFALTKELIKAKEIELTLFVLEGDLPLFDYAKNHCQIQIVPESLRQPVRDILWHQYRLPNLARRLKLDLIHLPSYRRLIRSPHIPTLGTIHDLAPFHLTGKYDWKRMIYGKHVVPFFARQTTRLTAVSQYTAQDITRFFGIPQSNITVILNGLDHNRFQPTTDTAAERDLRSKYHLDKPFFLYVARIEHPGKNHVRLIEAFNQIKKTSSTDWQLVFGGSDWHRAGVVHQAVKDSPYARDIRVTGFVPDEELPHLYRTANAFVYPSLFEGFGLPPVEAMACGCPVISSASGSLAEVIGKAALIIDPQSTERIANALIRFVGNDTPSESLRERGLANAQRFRWDKAAIATTLEYRRTLEEFNSQS